MTHFIALNEPANLNVLSVKGNRERPKEFPHVNYKITIIIAHACHGYYRVFFFFALSYWLFKLPISFAIDIKWFPIKQFLIFNVFPHINFVSIASKQLLEMKSFK